VVDAWPATLPQSSLVNGYGEGVGDSLLENQPDAGPPMTRRRSSATPRALSLSFVMDSDQIATLREFFDDTLLGGSLPFNFPGQVEDETYLVKFQKSGIPKWTALGGDDYIVNMMVWVLP
jgi:hypothetical protein